MTMSHNCSWPAHQGFCIVLICCVVLFAGVKGFELVIKTPESAVLNSTVNFTATLYDNGKVASSSNYKYLWSINTLPNSYSTEIPSKLPYSTWTLTFPIDTTPGHYRLSLSVQKEYILLWPTIVSNDVHFQVTKTLGGQMQLTQDGVLRSKLVSTKTPVNHTFTIPEYDRIYINKYASQIQTYWFQNHTFVGLSNGTHEQFVYNQTNQTYVIEALIIASIDLEPDIVTTTPKVTTLPPTSTTSTPLTTTTTTANITTSTSVSTSTQKAKQKSKRDTTTQAYNNTMGNGNRTSDSSIITNVNATSSQNHSGQQMLNNTLLHTNANTTLESILNSMDKNRTLAYGYYKREVIAKDPISNFTVDGKIWLQHDELTKLIITCKGSETIQLCTQIYDAPYNASGREVCPTYFNQSACRFEFLRYFAESKVVLFFIRNDISSTMNQVTINIYEAKKQSQLSVVVVPVTFTLVAIILVVFSVYYYIQSRHRFNVEVADFNFGETQSVDMEYKTFQQRLYESICDVLPKRWTFTRFHDASSDTEYEQNAGGGGNGGGGHITDNNTFYNTLS